MKKNSITVLAVFFLFLIWVIAGVIVDNQLLLPKPDSVFIAFVRLLTKSNSLTVILFTILRLLVSLLIAFVFGLGFGIIAGFSKTFATFINPFVTVLRTIPVISITVILLIIFGFSLTPYIITFLMLFPLIYQGIYGAIMDIDQSLIDVYKLEDNHFMTGLTHCYLPLIQRSIKTSLLQSLGLGIKVLVMAEYLSQTRNSIGEELYLAKVNLAYDEVFAWTILLIILALIFEVFIKHSKPISNKLKKVSNS